uniref:Solute carrier family 12 member 2 n=1 Tax=Plectus sambesii TaxID=2011161 RepID=A0A914XM99_9BILA
MASSAGRNDKVHPASVNPTFSAEEDKASNQPRPSHRFRVESIMEPSEADVAERSNIIRQQSSSANAQLQVEPTDAQLENIDINESTDNTVRYSIGTEHHALNKQNFPEIAIDNGLLNLCHAETLEKTPVIDFYLNSIDIERNMMARPSIDTLIHGKPMFPIVSVELNRMKSYNSEVIDVEDLEKYTSPPTSAGRVKFGWIEGVFVRCLLNILGVMLYLRISWVAGQAGIAWGSLIVLLASTVTTITTLSMCAICTNGEVKGGGAYFLISRSLGPEFGGSIGVIFSVANAVAAAMYVVGFAETVRDLMKDHGWIIIDNDVMDIRIIGLMTCTLLMAVVFVGTSFESRMQIGLLAILSVSIINFWVGTFIPVTETQILRGVTGYSLSTLATNMLPAWRGEDFFSVFAVYFPAATGIMAGANISGDLADPQMAIPKGTLLSIAVTTLIYLSTVWITGATCVRDATGLEAPTLANDSWKWIEPTCAANETCEYGLLNYFQVIQIESGWGPLITAGIFAATLSSALASLVSAPKVFQAVSKDHLFPYIQFFAKGYGKDEEPRRAYGLGFSIAMLMILIGDLNAIAPIISNFFLASYALINYACFAASFTDSPGFRPSFSYYNMWVSLGGALLCLIVMFIISWWTALITYLFFIMLFMYIHYRKPEVNWGTSTQAQSYKSALQSMLKLVKIQEHVKNYRPQLLVLTGNPIARPSLVDFVNNITKGSNLMICGHVIPYAYAPPDRALPCVRKSDRQLNEWLQNRRVKAFYVSTLNPSLRSGVQTLLHVAGLGKLRPNIVIIGFKSDWAKRGVYGIEDINEYFGIIQDVFGANMGMGMLRNSDCGFDFSELMEHQNASVSPKLQTVDNNTKRGDAKSKEKNNSNQLDVTSSQTPMDMRNDTSKEAR